MHHYLGAIDCDEVSIYDGHLKVIAYLKKMAAYLYYKYKWNVSSCEAWGPTDQTDFEQRHTQEIDNAGD
jgi:hypothetical protein